MKNILLILVFPLLLGNAISQVSPPVRLTNGNDDRNASFGVINNLQFFGFADFEFMVFERHSGDQSQICISKINSEGSVDSALYLTSGPYSNTNPVIDYNMPTFSNPHIFNALAVWQSDQFGRESLFGSAFDISEGWLEPFIIDSSAADNRNPVIERISSPFYLIVYESGEDIKYKLLNIFTHETSAEGNLTAQVTEVCSKPTVIGNFNSVFITYDKEISVDHKAIYFRTGPPDSIPLTENPGDTIIYSGKNHCLGFGNGILSYYPVIETDRNGNTDIYLAQLSPFYSLLPVIVDSNYDDLNYKGADVIVTDGYTNDIYSYLRRSSTDLRFIFHGSLNPVNIKISDDTNYHSSISNGNGVGVAELPCQRVWFVFNKDSADAIYPSTIYGISFTNCLSEINQINNSQPEGLHLSQNYPNPFNPKTHLEFGIPELRFVSLKIYDVLGNEVETLVNKNLPAGSYSVEWNAANFPSGIYFYKLTSGNFSEVKRMMLLK